MVDAQGVRAERPSTGVSPMRYQEARAGSSSGARDAGFAFYGVSRVRRGLMLFPCQPSYSAFPQ